MRTLKIRFVSVALLLALLTACAQAPPAPSEPAPTAKTARAPEGKVTSADGVEIAYSVRGEGPVALVFIHGWSCDQTYWRHQVEPFSAEHTVVTLDLPGHGKSGANRETWTGAGYAPDVAAVVNALKLEKVILIGHSMGGLIALAAAPLVPGKVIGVIGVDTLQNADFKWDPAQMEGWLAAYEKDFVGTCNQFVHNMFVAGEDPEIADETAADMCAADPNVAVGLMRDFPNVDYPALFRGAGVPIRAVNAANFPTQIEINRKYAPDFDAVIMEGVGHFPMLTRPEEFNQKLAAMVAGLLTAERR